MINDTLSSDPQLDEATERCRDLWANVLASGIRDFVAVETERRNLVREVKLNTPLGQDLKARVNRFVVVELDVERISDCYVAKPSEATLKRLRNKQKLLQSKSMNQVLVYMGRDRTTEWFWDDDQLVGTFGYIYALFPKLPPIDEFREMIMSNPLRFRNLNLTKQFRIVYEYG